METTIENKKSLSDDQFTFDKSETQVHQLSRPSLSYWQDAWIRLKKDRKALLSLFIVIAILLFTLVGPFIWSIDPSLQNLNFISQGPSLGKEALVVESNVAFEDIIIEDFPAEPEEEVDELVAPSSLNVVGEPTTSSITLKWEPVKGAYGYVIYRNERKPNNSNTLGIPLGETEAGNHVSYTDKLKLESRNYYYSVVATDGVDESTKYTTIEVTPLLALGLEDALRLNSNAKLGSKIRLQPHPLGTDYLGRDMLARLMHGGRVSFFIGIIAPFFYILFGTLYGGFSGFIGGNFDAWLMRFADFVVALPFLLFMILFSVAFGAGPGESGIIPMLVALIVLGWPATARLVRGQVLQLREEGFTQAARLLGARQFYILWRHMIPNTVGVILVTLTFAIPSAIFTEAFLSFIGMGVAPPTPSWGSMSQEGIKSMLSTPHELIFPSLFISISVLAFNLLGDGLRDALDARMRSRE